MNYYTTDFLVKIQAPIICHINGENHFFDNGKAFRRYVLNKPYMIESIGVDNNKMVISLTQKSVNERIGQENGKESVADSGSDFAKKYKEKFGKDPSFF